MSFCVESDIQSIVHLDAYGWILNVIETFVLQERTKNKQFVQRNSSLKLSLHFYQFCFFGLNNANLNNRRIDYWKKSLNLVLT